MPVLIFEQGPLRGKRVSLPAGALVRFGRDPSCNVRLKDRMVSRLHCVIRHINGRWILEDHQSRNKTFVNSLCITKTDLAPGDFIQIGDTAFSFLSSQKDPLAGLTIGGFFIQERVGRGGMASVYLARQVSLARQVAVKLLASRFTGDADFVQRFIREARSAARLNHPNIVQIHDSGCDNDHNYIAMEYLPGGTLADQMFREGRLDYKKAVDIALAALHGVSYAETMGLVHRDIKPGNLLFTASGDVKIADFGIALDLSDPEQLMEGLAAGSPAYMAPEQIRGQNIDTRADLYAVGATLYHAISGEKPCKGDTVKEMLADKLKNDPVPLKSRIPTMPTRLSHVVDAMLARQPEERIANADEAINALEKSLAPPTKHKTPLHHHHQKKNRNKPSALAAAVMLMAFAVLAFLGFYVYNQVLSSDRESDVNRHGSKDSKSPSSLDGQGKRPPEGTGNTPTDQHSAFTINEQGHQQSPSHRKTKPPPSKKPLSDEEVAQKTKAAESAAAEIQKLLDADALVEAYAAIQKLRRNPFSEKWTGPLRTSLREKSRALLDAQKTIIQARCDQGKLIEAKEALAKLTALLPATERKLTAALNQYISLAERKKQHARRELPKLKEQVFKQLAGLKGTAALETLDALLQEHGTLTQELTLIKQDVAVVIQIYDGLVEKIQSMIQSKAATTLRFKDADAEAGYTPKASYIITALNGHVLTLQVPAKPRTIVLQPLFSLHPALLIDFIGSVEGLTLQDIKTALGCLVFLRCGPTAAEACFADIDTAHNRYLRFQETSHSLTNTWARVRFNELEADYAKNNTDTTPPERLDYWAREVLALASIYAPDRRQRDKTKALETIFLAVRPKTLLTKPLAQFCHAAEVQAASNGLTMLSYDFSTPRQHRDFVLITDADKGGRLAIEGNALVLTGEMRFLRSEPFQDALSVTGKIARCDTAASNINLGLWTAERDRLSPRFRSSGVSNFSKRPLHRLKADYMVFSIGFYIPPTGGAGGVQPFVREPVFGLFSGTRQGLSVGGNTSTLIWQAPSGRLPHSAFAFKAESYQDNLTWAIGSRYIPLNSVTGIAILKKNLSRKGSFSIFTNGKTVFFSELKVTGMLRKKWPTEAARSQAEAEWKAATAPPASSAAPGRPSRS